VDNIPGVKGVGTKTALALLQTFSSLEAIYADLARVATLPLRNAKTLRQKLAVGREVAFLPKRLATIALDAPVMYDPYILSYRAGLTTEVTSLFDNLGFRRLAQQIMR
jgi:DNA polymerase I